MLGFTLFLMHLFCDAQKLLPLTVWSTIFLERYIH
jgi:hypothetical protein